MRLSCKDTGLAMALGLLGTKLGMTTAFDERGRGVAVTLLEITPNRVTQVKTVGKEGYNAVQLGVGEKRRPTKAEAGHAARSGGPAPAFLREFRLAADPPALGSQITVDLFADVAAVDVSARSKGKGFAGVVKRHNFSRGPKTHGSKAYRRPKSSGTSATPSEVLNGRPMPGHMGAAWTTCRNVKVLKVDVEKGLLIVKGATPGPNGCRVVVCPTRKRRRHHK